MKHPDEYAWELMRGLESGDAYKDYIEEAGYNRYQKDREYVITDDGLRYIEKFLKGMLRERTTENR